jgi:hypothetical protein
MPFTFAAHYANLHLLIHNKVLSSTILIDEAPLKPSHSSSCHSNIQVSVWMVHEQIMTAVAFDEEIEASEAPLAKRHVNPLILVWSDHL